MNPLARHYSRFRVAERRLLTGHSHQAWPDVSFDAQQQAWLDAASLVDGKWDQAARQADRVRAGVARLLGDQPDRIALGQNTHELVTRFLSALPLDVRPRLISSDEEFHTIRRQLDRLAEAGLEIVKIAAAPVATLAERLAAGVDDRTAAVLVSSVLFDTAARVPHLDVLAAACDHRGARLLVDAYHHVNVIPFDVSAMRLGSAFITGGGYKYCQLGEGNAFLRVPPDARLRPVLTGWFAEFEAIEESGARSVAYPRGAGAFAGATYDPTSHYRGAAVFAFHQEQGLTPEVLHAINRAQIALLTRAFESLDLDPVVARIVELPDALRGGFLAIETTQAHQVSAALRTRGVWTDARGPFLRLGPAPYLRDDQLQESVAILGEVLREPPAGS